MSKQKVIIITGGSSGIGKALAIEAAKRNYTVVITGRNEERLKEVYHNIAAIQPNCHYVLADVSNEENCKKIVEDTIKKFGQIDILINNAGISMRALFNDLKLDVIKSLMDTNFWGTVYCTKFALPYIIQQKGSIVAISSIAGFTPLPARTGYAASKSAIHGFLNTLRLELKPFDVHVMIAAPGFTESNIRYTALTANGTPQGESPRSEEKMMKADEVAFRVLNAIEKRKRQLILTTQGKLTVTLYKFLPNFVDSLIYKHMKKEPNSPLK
ncbi:MAG: SDR family oxidoreductase [Bacteroidales bacterium]|nr:SDR family oxidoreductase [Bacteroidales bacterium]